MRVNVLFFASLVDIVGTRRLALEMSGDVTVAQLVDRLESTYPRLKDYASVLRTAVNERYAERSDPVSDGDEVAIFPPVSGGSISQDALRRSRENGYYEITYEPIDTARLGRTLRSDADGAICMFEGVVRNHSKGRSTRYLVYEAYEGMALKKMEEIGQRILTMWPIDSVGVVHRLGRLDIGETSVAIVVTSPHRRAAFDACHYAIDLLKTVVPIWKKEYFEDGEVWVEGQG